jgi:hypothetical protein
MSQAFHKRALERPRQVWHCLVVSLGILALTISLASRTVNLRLSAQASVASQAQHAEIQHRDRDAFGWAPILASSDPFYLPVVSEPVVLEKTLVRSEQVDTCLYNRPPPHS